MEDQHLMEDQHPLKRIHLYQQGGDCARMPPLKESPSQFPKLGPKKVNIMREDVSH